MGAVSSTFPYRLGEEKKVDARWTLHDGQRKADNEEVSIFVFDKRHASADELHAAKHYEKRLKTLRYPHVMKFLDSTELPESLYIVCERVSPLNIGIDGVEVDPKTIPLGLFQIASAVSFLNNDCKMSHCSVSPQSVFISKSGDWKLGGLFMVYDSSELSRADWGRHAQYTPQLYQAPDLANFRNSYFKDFPMHALDSWALGCLIYEVFTGSLARRDQLKDTSRIPQSLIPQYQRLLANNAAARLTASQLLMSPYFNSDIVKTVDFLDQLTVKSDGEKDAFFRDIQDRLGSLPDTLARYRVLPCLVNALEYGSVTTSAPRVLSAMLSISSGLKPEEFATMVQPTLLKLFACNDRAVRAGLLKALPDYIIHLSDSIVNESIWPNITTGFTDTEPRLREATIKALLCVLPKLKDKTIHASAFPLIQKMQRDPVPGIRTNTVVAIGKVAKFLSPASRDLVLLRVFCLALRDPFVPSRQQALAAFQSTAELFTADQIAKSIIPVISLHLIDPAKNVREQAIKTTKTLLTQIEGLAASMGDQKQSDSGTSASTSSSQQKSGSIPTDLNSATALAGKITNWAVGSISKRLLDNGPNKAANASNDDLSSRIGNLPSRSSSSSEARSGKPSSATSNASTTQPYNDSRSRESFSANEDHDALAAYSIPDNNDSIFAGLSPSSAAEPAISDFDLSALSIRSPSTYNNPVHVSSEWDSWLNDDIKVPTIPLAPSSSVNSNPAIPPPSLKPATSKAGTLNVQNPKPAVAPLRTSGLNPRLAKSNTKNTFDDDFFNNW